MKKIFTLFAVCVLGVMGAWAQVVKWNVSNTAYSAGQELSPNTDVVSVKLGETEYSWLYNSGRGGITTYVQGSPANGGSYIVVKPTKDISLSLATYSSMSNCNLKMYEESNPSTILKDFRQKGAVNNDFGTLQAGKTYYIYGEGFKTSAAAGNTGSIEYIFFKNFTATSYETYNVYYVDNQYSNQIKAHREGSALFGSNVRATDEDKANIEYAGSTYIYASGDEEITIGTENNDISLRFNKAAAAPTTYTIKYQLSDGTEIAESVNHNSVVGQEVSAEDAEVPEFITKSGVKYKYVSGNTPITLVEDAASNVITLIYTEETKYTYTLTKSIAGTPAGTIASGTVYENEESPLIFWPKYIKDNGKYYRSSFYTGNYGRQFYGSQNWDENVNYVEDNSIDYFIEGENMSKSRSAAASLTGFSYSGGTSSRHYANSQWWTEAMPKGVYTLKVSYYNTFSSGTDMYIGLRDSEGNIVDTDKAFILYGARATTEEIADITIPDGYALVLNNKNTYNSNGYIDYITMKKTAEVVETNASKTASYVTASALDFTDSGLKAYVATECDGSKIKLKEVTAVAAGQAIVVKSETENASVKVKVAAGEVSPETNLFQTGAITVAAGQNVYALSKNDGEFHKVAEGTDIPAGKAYIIASSAAKTLALDFDGAATGINSAVATKLNGAAFNLMGQKVSANAKGIVIINGKKVVK